METEQDYPTVGGEEAGYLFEFRPDGVFFTVYPNAAGSILYELSDMRQILKDYGVNDYDILTLAQTVRRADGKPVRLADSYKGTPHKTQLQELDAEIVPDVSDEGEYAAVQVDVSRDKLTATVRYDTKKGTRVPTVEMIHDALAAKGVKNGIDEAAITRGAESLSPFVAARGTPAVHGQNARIEKKYDLSYKGKPKVIKNDRVDYKDMNLFVLAHPGQLLAVRIPQTKGTAGRDVYGGIVVAKNGRPIPLQAGKNTEIRDENRLYATIEGQIVEKGRIISVDPHLDINSAVGVGTGNIEFTGSVEIHGGVEAGFTVRATGDIMIHGGVSGAEVLGRNIFIEGGVTGQGKGHVTAEEDIHAAFAENAFLEAGRDVYVSDVILHSTVRAGKNIVMDEGRGMITGGFIAAGEEVRAKTIGNQAYVSTKITVGVNPAIQQRYQKACRDYKEDKQRLGQITSMLNTFSKIDISTLPPNRVKQINELTRSQFPLAGKIKRTEKLIQDLQEELSKMKKGKVRVKDIIYPGVHVSVNDVMRNFQTEARGCTLALNEDGEIVIGPY